MLQAVIFDFDGVIADSEPIHCQAFLDVLPRYGIPLTEELYYRDYLGYTDADMIAALCEDFHIRLEDQTRVEALAEKADKFAEFIRQKDPLIAGVPAFVMMLKENGLPLGICSGALKSDIEMILDGGDFSRAFDVIVTADDVAKGKPDPEGFLIALDRLNETTGRCIDPAGCVVIEDSFWGLQAAQAAGMKRVAVTHTYPREQLQAFADCVVDDVKQIRLSDLQVLCR